MRISLILPVYNEYGNLKRNFMRIYSVMKKIGSFEIIIAENGTSKDGTIDLAKKFSKLPNVSYFALPKAGKGGALKKGIELAKGKTIGYIDIDLSVPATYIPAALDAVEAGNAVVYGSRYEKNSKEKVIRSNNRFVASKVFNFLLKNVSGSKLRDHQCGFKFYDSKFIKPAARAIPDSHFFFDVATLLRAQRHHVTLSPLPVPFKEMRYSKIKRKDIIYYLNCIGKDYIETHFG
jgi:glycosyltransferase involved in cell wall biosynthesis